MPRRPVCGYFLLGNSRETRLTVSRLQTAHVIVDRLARRTVVRDYRPYGDAPRRRTLPAGTYWISLAQAQKHWVQAALNEDTYVPFPYFYDVSGWSLPLLAGIQGGYTGRHLHAPVVRVPTLHRPTTPRPHRVPRIAVIDQFGRTPQRLPVLRLAQVAAGPGLAVPLPGAPAEAGHRLGAAQGRRPGRGERRLQAGVPAPRRQGSCRCRGVGRAWRSVRRLAGGGPAGVGSRDLTGGHEYAEGRVARGDDADPYAARTATRSSGTATTTSSWPLEEPDVVGAFPPPHVHLRVRHEARDPGRHGSRDGREARRGSVTVFGYEPNFRAVADGSARPAQAGDPANARRLRCLRRTPLTTPRNVRPSVVLGLAHTRAWRLAHDTRS